MKRKKFLVMVLLLLVAGAANAVIVTDSDTVDMTGTIYAQNFWDVAWPFGGVTFESTGVGTGWIGVQNDAVSGALGGVGMATLGLEVPQWNGYFNGSIYSPDAINFTTDLGDGEYTINVLIMEQWGQGGRDVTLSAEGDSAVEALVGGVWGGFDAVGQLLSLTTTVTDGSLNFSVSQDPQAANMHIGALYIQTPEPATMLIMGLGGLFLRRRRA